MATELKKRRIEIGEENQLHLVEETRKPILNVDKLFRKYAQKQSFLLPMLSPGTYLLAQDANTYLLIKEIYQLPFNTSWGLELTKKEDTDPKQIPVLTPCWSNGVKFDPALMWEPPKGCRLVLFLKTEIGPKEPITNPTVNSSRSYLLLFRERSKEFAYPPFPNQNVTSGNGMCTGGLEFNPRAGLNTALEDWCKSWMENDWNTDWTPNGDWSQLVRFDPTTKKQLPANRNYWSQCHPVSPQNLPSIFEQGLNSYRNHLMPAVRAKTETWKGMTWL